MKNEEVYECLKRGEILKVDEMIKTSDLADEKSCVLRILLNVFKVEAANDSDRIVFSYSLDIDKLVSHFEQTKMLLRRIDFDMPEKYIDVIYDYLEATGVTVYFLDQIIQTNMIHKGKVCLVLSGIYAEKKGNECMEAQHFYNMYKRIGGDL
jgi:hypothetical protein